MRSFWILIAIVLAAYPTRPLLGDEIDFVRDVQPILSENCYFCHGPDSNQRQADLRLDTPEGLSAVIEAHRRDESELFRRVVTLDEDEIMPPVDSHRKLSKAQIETLGNWISEGARWETHWSFRPIVKPPVPPVASKFGAPIRNPIDVFVQHRLAETPLLPNPEAERTTLIRRLSLDLNGLPPTPEQVRAFVNSDADDAYEALVDTLLDSAAYGERMAWDWLDAARYADTNGYQGDRERTMWPWRDWVVRAFNKNMPYDQFTVWQLAGDLLPEATDEQRLATAFCRNHMINGEGGRIPEENRVEYVFDMTETTATVWLGLTMNCCRCHDHKYDPISKEDYYRLFAYFNQTPVTGQGGDPQTAPQMEVATSEQLAQFDQLVAQLNERRSAVDALKRELAPQQTPWEQQRLQQLEAAPAPWTTLRPTHVEAVHQQLEVQQDLSIVAGGPTPDRDTYTIVAQVPTQQLSGLRIEALLDLSDPSLGLSRASSGNFVLTDIEVSLRGSDQVVPLEIVSGEATFEQGNHGIAKAFDDQAETGWAVYEGRVVDREHAAVLKFATPVDVPSTAILNVVLRHDSQHRQHNLGRFRLSVTGADSPSLQDADSELLAALRVAAEHRTDEQRDRVQQAHWASHPDFQDLAARQEEFQTHRTNFKNALPKVMIMQDMAKPRKTYLLERGLYNKTTEEVTAATPEFLGRLESTAANRLELARWIVSDDNPLTARVTVNRIWQQFFGIGLVKTPEDFGAQGEIPEHMELLNWLAAEFRDSGWDVKALVRMIVTSHTYRQSSKRMLNEQQEFDPDNRLLSRGARFRLPSWMLRDQALAASGLLSGVRKGPAVNTYQPPGVWEEATFGKKKYVQGKGDELYRRSLFVFWRRIIAPTMFFDSASRQTCTVKSTRTNTPLHALLTLNDVLYVESARQLAQQVLLQEPSDEIRRLDSVMQRVLAREATPQERNILLAGVARAREQFSSSPEEAQRLLAVGQSDRDSSLDAIEHASWTSLCLAVLNLDETLNRE